jgi:hypothetical protein
VRRRAVSVLLILILDLVLSLVFLLPLKDDRGPGKRFPAMTWTLIVINTVIHVVFHYLAPAWLGDEESWAKFQMMFVVPIPYA